MAELNESDFVARYNHASTGLYKDNTTNEISEADLRDLVTYISDSVLFSKSDRYTVFQQFTTTTSTTAYVGTTSPAITAYANGQVFQVKAHATSTGAVTFNWNTLGAKKVYTNPTTQATTGSLVINTIYLVAYDTALDSAVGGFLIVGGSGGGGTWGSITGTLSSQTDLQTALNAKLAIAPRLQSVTSSATVTPDADANDMVVITAQAAGLTLANPTGTPAQGQGLIIRVKDNGTARSITFGADYRDVGTTLPTTTTISKITYIVCLYNSTDSKWDIVGVRTEDEATGGGGTSYWTDVPGTPVRVGNTSFTITDTANANLYNLLLSRKTVLKWTDTGTVKMAMVVSATYSSNNVTVTIIGDTLSSGATMSTFKYTFEKAHKVTFAYAGVLATGTNISRKYKADCQTKVFGADGLHGTAGTTNATTYDINKNGTTFMTTKLSIASAATVGDGFTADDSTELALDDVVSLDCDSVSTTQPIDVYVDLFIFPKQNIYLS